MSREPGAAAGCAVLVMAKAPRPGRAKTRLHPLVGPEGAAALQAALVRGAAELACSVGPTFLAVDPPDALEEVRPLVPPGAALLGQVPGDLGTRMSAAVERVVAVTGGPVVVLGVDVPTLGAERVRRAAALLAEGADVVLGPALDGGYYLIGLRRADPAAFAIDPALWGGPRVLAETLAALAAAGREVALLDPLRDLDTPDDARALLAEGALPGPVADLLRPAAA